MIFCTFHKEMLKAFNEEINYVSSWMQIRLINCSIDTLSQNEIWELARYIFIRYSTFWQMPTACDEKVVKVSERMPFLWQINVVAFREKFSSVVKNRDFGMLRRENLGRNVDFLQDGTLKWSGSDWN